VARVDDDHLSDGAACRHIAPVPVGDLLSLPPGLGLAQRLELHEGALADDAVKRQTGVALEVQDGVLGLLVQHAPLGACVEPQQVELDLQRQDVVAAERGFAEVQQPVSRRVARFDQLAPGVGADDPVHEQAAALLERAYGELGVWPEVAVHALSPELEPLRQQAGLDVEDFFAAVAAGEIAHE
jgi:hypothetical protein